jgi:dsDNA-specific endonuclease/ATPase MutS2
MKWHIGDSVRFLNEPITGMIKSLRSDGWAEVETQDGMYLSVPTNQLVKVHDLEKSMGPKDMIQEEYSRKDFPIALIKKKEELIINEFDLHIEELGIPYKNLNNYEIVRQQLNYFENKLGECIRNKISPVNFIHGVGNGVLRQEIHKRLKKNPYVSHFKDNGKDLKRFGATEVYLKP